MCLPLGKTPGFALSLIKYALPRDPAWARRRSVPRDSLRSTAPHGCTAAAVRGAATSAGPGKRHREVHTCCASAAVPLPGPGGRTGALPSGPGSGAVPSPGEARAGGGAAQARRRERQQRQRGPPAAAGARSARPGPPRRAAQADDSGSRAEGPAAGPGRGGAAPGRGGAGPRRCRSARGGGAALPCPARAA